MSGPISFHIPEPEDVRVSWEVDSDIIGDLIVRTPVPRDYRIEFRARPDEDGTCVYQFTGGAMTRGRPVKTVGDLSLGDIGRTSISIEWNGDTISGVICDIRTDTDTVRNSLMVGDRRYRRGDRRTRVRILFKNFVVSDLPIDHPCEVVS